MGPEATADLYLRIIRIFQRQYGAIYDSDFPEILIYNLPLPDVVENSTSPELIKQTLIRGIQKLAGGAVDFIAVPCNTVMYYRKDLLKSVSVPVINIVDQTIDYCKARGITTLGIISTSNTRKTRLYKSDSLTVLYPTLNQQRTVTSIILTILTGRKRPRDRAVLKEIIQSLLERGAQKVILGCTELPLLWRNGEKVIDPNQILAEAVVRECTLNSISAARALNGEN